jgi:hypothetical protein
MTVAGVDLPATASPVGEGAMPGDWLGAVVRLAVRSRPCDESKAPPCHHRERLGVVVRRTHPMAVPQDGCAYPQSSRPAGSPGAGSSSVRTPKAAMSVRRYALGDQTRIFSTGPANPPAQAEGTRAAGSRWLPAYPLRSWSTRNVPPGYWRNGRRHRESHGQFVADALATASWLCAGRRTPGGRPRRLA